VRINDISVSRCHALIKFVPGDGFYVEDNQSKFGTIVMLKERIEVKTNHTLAIQVGRTVVSFTARDLEQQAAPKKDHVTLRRQVFKPRPTESITLERH